VNVRVSRSPLRLLTYALLAVPAILLAIDMTVSYRFVRHPETRDVVVGQTTDESGQQVDVTEAVLTDTGRAERRRDLLFGGGLFIGGVLTLGWSMRQLISPTEFFVADDEGLLIRVDGIRRPPRRVPWPAVAEIRSGVLEDDGDTVPVLSIRFSEAADVPVVPAGGVSDPPWLHLFSDEWEIPAHQVAALVDHRITTPPPAEEGST
jgi:hypothetical protein